jgi:signal transduction histidine kinase
MKSLCLKLIDATTRFFKVRIVALVGPRKQEGENEDDRRHEFILNIILAISSIFLIILDGTILYNKIRLGNHYHGVSFTLFVLLTLASLFGLNASKKGYAKTVSYLLIALYTFGSLYTGWHWGVSLPATLLSFTLIIVVSGVLIDSKFAFGISLFLLLMLIILGYHEIYFLKELPWKNETIDRTDIITYGSILVFIVGISWLSNREIEQSLRRARRSEYLLKEERDFLEIKVEERTHALKKAQTERTQELSQIAEFGKLSQGIFHDLVAPLSTIVLYTEKFKTIDIPEVRNAHEYIDKAVVASKRMGVFMENIKKNIKNSSDLERFSVVRECESVLDMYAYQMREQDIVVEKKYPENDIFYFGNSIHINRIFSNLISNSTHALKTNTDKKKKIRIEIQRRKNETTKQEDIQITFSDTGSGIPDTIISKIFDPFFTTKNKSGGTGIGLTTVKNIVKDTLHGEIEVISKETSGTSFSIVFPIR